MSDVQKMIAEIAAQFMLAKIQAGSPIDDSAYSRRCVARAKEIVNGAMGI
ncbi:hypothetical protein PANO111632_02690 [Paracoccus nototheniae]